LDDNTEKLAKNTFVEIDTTTNVDDRIEKTDLLTSLVNTFKSAMTTLSRQPVGPGPAPLAVASEKLVQTDVGKEVGKSVVSGAIKGTVDAANMVKDVSLFTGQVLNPIANKMLQEQFKKNYGINLDNANVTDLVMPIFGLTTKDFEDALKEIEPETEYGQIGSELTAFLVASSLMPGGGTTGATRSFVKGALGDAAITPRVGNLASLAEELGVQNEFVSFMNSYIENPNDVSSFERLKARVKGATTDSVLIGSAFLAATKIVASKIGQIGLTGAAVTASTTEEGEASGIGPLIKAGLDYLGFFSKAQDEALKLTQEKGMGKQFKNMLINAGVKKDEIEWTGLDEVLNKENVTKQEIVEHLDLNKIQIREHVRDRDQSELDLNWNDDDIRLDNDNINEGRIPPSNFLEEGKLKATLTPEEAFGPEYIANRADELKEDYDLQKNVDTDPDLTIDQAEKQAIDEYYGDPIRILEDQTTGIVLTGTDEIGWTFFASRADATNYKNAINKDNPVYNLNEAKIQVQQHAMDNDLIAPDYEATLFKDYTIPGGENYREFTLQLSDENRSPTLKNAVFQSNHFPEKDIIAHIRTTDRKAVDGGKILYVEEIQSDWAQTGRKSGFRKSEEELTKLKQQLKDANAELDEIVNKMSKDGSLSDNSKETLSNKKRREELTQFIAKNRIYDDQGFLKASTPKAPFVTSTSQWTDLTIKRLLAIANEEGYDYISFSPGHIHKDRYGAEGNVKFYDEIIPARIKKIINKMDKDARVGVIEVDTETSQIQDMIEDSVTIILTPKVKEAVSKGQSLFAPAIATVGGGSLALSNKETRQ
tara:strand:+ start:3045 stop:5507 length:2463 start_codon:yes stop_codon:yes gene_type:complete